MKRKTFVFLLFLSLLALFVVDYDYVCGHMGEDPYVPEVCPICASFNSTELGHLFVFILLLLGIFPLIGLFTPTNIFSFKLIHLSNLPARSPPFV